MDQAAERQGDRYRISATKSWATSAGHADYYVVPLRASPYADPNELTLFLVPGRGPGVQVMGTWDGSGMRGNCSTPVQFDLTVPKSARLGPSGHGFQLLFAYGLPAFQLGLAAVYLGIGQAAYDAAALHAVRRIYADTGRPKAHSAVTQQDIAEMKLRLDTARSLLYVVAKSATDRERRGEDPVDLAGDTDFIIAIAQTKVAACEAATAVTDTALRVCGGSAYKRGHVVERCYRDARAGSVMGPDDDSLKILIGQRLLGVPFPWSIRDA
jgi:alkylation response protein AidB-like acyl-CoA dehydrogenase